MSSDDPTSPTAPGEHDELTLSTRVRHRVRRLVRRGHELLGDQPAFLPVQRLLTPESARDRAITDRTQLVIEGFPRSGNTFAATAFAAAQTGQVVVASHVHLPAQVKLAVQREVPVLLLVRQPGDAVVSMAVADPHHRVADLLRYWVHYHRELEPFLAGVLVATFDQVTGDFGAVTRRLNDRFSTSFTPFDHEPDSEAEVFAEIDRKQLRVHGRDRYLEAVARPEPTRDAARDRRRLALAAAALDSLRTEADALYAGYRHQAGETT